MSSLLVGQVDLHDQDNYLKEQDNYLKEQDSYLKDQDSYLKDQDSYLPGLITWAPPSDPGPPPAILQTLQPVKPESLSLSGSSGPPLGIKVQQCQLPITTIRTG